MKIFEVTAEGFDGASSDTDHLVFWVTAPDAQMVRAVIAETGARFCGEIIVKSCIDYTLPAQSQTFRDELVRLRGLTHQERPHG